MNQSRRTFLKSMTAGALAAPFAPNLLLAQKSLSPNDKVNIAMIGVGGIHSGMLKGRGAIYEHNLVAFADVDDSLAAEVYGNNPKVPTYRDFRRMLDRHDSQIDAVMIGTPDITHFIMAKAAMERGKHVFCQKPLTRTLWECSELKKLAKKTGLITQMGNQGHAFSSLRTGVEWLQSGVIGDVTEAHVWSNRSGNGATQMPEAMEPPDTLSWDLWLGASKYYDYSDQITPKKWRGWWSFGTGPLGDIGCHTIDMLKWGLELGVPQSVSAETTEVTEVGTPKSSVVTYQFPARGGKPPVKIVWFDGGKVPPRPADLEKGREIPKSGGAFIFGSKGTIYAPGMRPSTVRLIPETKMQEVARAKVLPDPWLPRVGDIVDEWLDGIGNGAQPSSNFVDYSCDLTEMILLGNLAIRTGRTIRWDRENLKAKGLPQADRFIFPETRKGWGV